MNKLKKFKKEKNQLITESEVESKLDILVKGQINNWQELEAIRNDLQRGFLGLALRNEKLNQKLEIAVSELNAMKKEREETNPVKATTYTAGMLLEICGGKYAKYSVLCAVWATTTTVGLVSGNPALIAVGLEAGNEILEDFYS